MTTAIARIVTSQEVPFSARLPTLQLGAAAPNWKYAFNYDDPRGVKLLADRVFSRLLQLGGERGIPSVDTLEQEEDACLYQHGLIKVAGRYTARGDHATQSFNVWLHISSACNVGCFYCYIPGLKKHITELGSRLIKPTIR